VAKAEDGYFQWEAVVRGEVDGNKLSGATKILQTLNSTSETSARQKLESDIQFYHHAGRLALDKIQAVPLKQLIIDIMEFKRLSGMNVPLAPCIVVCGKYVTTLVAQEKWNEAASVLRLWYQDTAEKNFSEKRPLFSAVASKCQNKEEQQQVVMGMLEAFFSNAVIDLFAEPLNSTVDKTLGHPFELAVAMLEQYAAMPADVAMDFEDVFVEAMEVPLAACRAIVAVSSPVPGKFDSSYEDVKDVMGDHVYDRTITSVELAGVAIDIAGVNLQRKLEMLRIAMNRNPGWKARLSSYWTLGQEDQAAAPILQNALRPFGDKDATPATPGLKDIKFAMETARSLQSKIRQGGCQPIFDALEAWAVAQQDLADKSEAEEVVMWFAGFPPDFDRHRATDRPQSKEGGIGEDAKNSAEQNRPGDWLSALGNLVRHDPGRGEHPVSRWLEQGADESGCL